MDDERAIRLHRVVHITKLSDAEIQQVEGGIEIIEKMLPVIADHRDAMMMSVLRETGKRMGVQQLMEIDREDLIKLIHMNTAKEPFNTRIGFLCPNYECKARVEPEIHPHYCGTCGQAIQWK